MTRIIGLLSWFDESPARLAACVASMGRFCDHVVALDGRYAQYPDARNRSGTAEYAAIIDAAHAAGVGITVCDGGVYADEMEKRTHLFQIGATHATTFQDWFFVLDADEMVAEAIHREGVHLVLDRIAAEGCDVAPVTFWEKADPAANEQVEAASRDIALEYRYETPSPRFWRVLRDMRVVGYHYNYIGENEAGSTVELWGNDRTVVKRADWSQELMPLVTIENRNRMRAKVRDQSRQAYYDVRDASGIEAEKPLAVYENDEVGVCDGAAF
jgi:hypothetical protein